MSKELKTGISALLIIALGIWGYNFMKRQDLFSPNSRHFYVEYDNINGLSEASIVTINGLKVGKVDAINFNTKPEKRGALLVRLSIEDDFQFSKNSIAKIYSAGLMGGQNLAIIPNYEGSMALSGDYLKGEIESDLFSSVGEKLNPLQAKLENVLVEADSLLIGLNQVLDKKAKQSLNKSVVSIENSVASFNKTMTALNQLLLTNEGNINIAIENTKKMTSNFSKVSEDLVKTDLGATVKKIESTLSNVNTLIEGVEGGRGTVGKLISDDKLYTNLTRVTKEMEELLREVKLNPKRFVHFSLFGKRPKPYGEQNSKENLNKE